jgi:hypothetical protein
MTARETKLIQLMRANFDDLAGRTELFGSKTMWDDAELMAA